MKFAWFAGRNWFATLPESTPVVGAIMRHLQIDGHDACTTNICVGKPIGDYHQAEANSARTLFVGMSFSRGLESFRNHVSTWRPTCACRRNSRHSCRSLSRILLFHHGHPPVLGLWVRGPLRPVRKAAHATSRTAWRYAFVQEQRRVFMFVQL